MVIHYFGDHHIQELFTLGKENNDEIFFFFKMTSLSMFKSHNYVLIQSYEFK